MSEEFRRWYDKDPILKEALELLRLQEDETKADAADFIIKLQENVAAEVIEHVYDMVKKYEGKGNRWYDKDPVISKTVELLRIVPPDMQKQAAKNFLKTLENMGVVVETEQN